MRTFALETTEPCASIAALDQGNVIAEMSLPPHQRSAQSLAPGIQRLLDKMGWTPRDVKLVAVSIGPGSFTGLRVGVTTAKTLAYALGADIIGVNTLEAIAARAPSNVDCLWAAMNAYRRQVFAAKLVRDQNAAFCLNTPIRLLDVDQWLASLRPGDRVTGPALREYASGIPAGVQTLDEAQWSPTASCVGQLGWHQYQLGARGSLWTLAPLYLRPSAAEERRA